MARLLIEPVFKLDELDRVLAALDASQEHDLAARLRQTRHHAIRVFEAQEEARQAEQELRAKRAENHILTKRQAECLAAIRAGKGPYYKWDTRWATPQWSHVRSMGGAVSRMVAGLIDEGMLTDRRKLTEAGLDRLEAWEAKHGKLGS